MPRKTACFRFSGALNDFLPLERQGTAFSLDFQGDQSVKHLFESCGVPHTEVERVFANGVPVDQKYIVQDGDRVELFPPGLPPAPAPEDPPAPPRFVLDNHLGRLAAYLRLLGFDALYRNNLQDDELACIASGDGWVLLTRDRRLLMRSVVTQGYCLRSTLPRRQVVEVLTRYGLFEHIVPFGRCARCNSVLEPVPKEQIIERLQPLTRLYFDEFQRCPGCDQVYWKGSHYERMREFIQELRTA